LRHASGQGRAFDYKPAIFRLVELHMKNHGDILPVKCGRVETKGWAADPEDQNRLKVWATRHKGAAP
jgi:hypothetical protein